MKLKKCDFKNGKMEFKDDLEKENKIKKGINKKFDKFLKVNKRKEDKIQVTNKQKGIEDKIQVTNKQKGKDLLKKEKKSSVRNLQIEIDSTIDLQIERYSTIDLQVERYSTIDLQIERVLDVDSRISSNNCEITFNNKTKVLVSLKGKGFSEDIWIDIEQIKNKNLLMDFLFEESIYLKIHPNEYKVYKLTSYLNQLNLEESEKIKLVKYFEKKTKTGSKIDLLESEDEKNLTLFEENNSKEKDFIIKTPSKVNKIFNSFSFFYFI